MGSWKGRELAPQRGWEAKRRAASGLKKLRPWLVGKVQVAKNKTNVLNGDARRRSRDIAHVEREYGQVQSSRDGGWENRRGTGKEEKKKAAMVSARLARFENSGKKKAK